VKTDKQREEREGDGDIASEHVETGVGRVAADRVESHSSFSSFLLG